MALPIDEDTFKKKASSSGIQQMAEGDLIAGANKFMGQLNQSINGMSKLMEGWATIKDKLVPTQKAVFQPGQRQQKQVQYVEPAIKTAPIPRTEKTEEATPMTEEKTDEQKLEKAKVIFKELHELVKPHLLLAKTVTAGYVIGLAMQPKYKERIIEEIAKRL